MRDFVLRRIRRWSKKSRSRRWELMRSRIDWTTISSVLDLGGTPGFWASSDLTHLPIEITCLNLAGTPETRRVGNMTIHMRIADATRPPCAPESFDLVFSNSVIEHVGDDVAIERLAAVLRAGPQYFVQTPNRFFLVEPHFILPFHFLLPRWVKSLIVTVWDRGPKRRSFVDARERVDSIRLLTGAEVSALFPDAEIVKERKWLQVKSFMAFGPIDAAADREALAASTSTPGVGDRGGPASVGRSRGRGTELVRQSSRITIAAGASVVSGLLLDVSIAAGFGAGRASDSFFVGARIPLMLAVMVMVGANQALVPAFSTWLARKGEAETWRLVSVVLSVTLLAGFGLAALAALLAGPVMALTAPGLDATQADLAASVARVMFLVVPLVGSAEVLRALLNARYSFAAPAAMNVVMNGIAAVIVFESPGDNIMVIAWAYAVGSSAQLVFMLVSAYRRGFRYRPSLAFADPDVRAVGRLCTRPLISASFNPAARLGEQLFLSFLPSGSITIVNYGYRLVSAVGGSVFFRSVIVALVPRLTEATVRGDREEVARTTRVGLLMMLAISIPLTAFMAVLAGPAALVVFRRGDFARADASLLGLTLAIYAASLVGSAVQRALLAPFFSRLDTRVPLRNSFYGVAANLISIPPLLLLFGRNDARAVIVVPIAYSLAQYVNVGHAWSRLKKIADDPARGIAGVVGRIVAATAAATVTLMIGYSVAGLGERHTRIGVGIRTGLVAAAGLAVLAITLKVVAGSRLRELLRLRHDGIGPGAPDGAELGSPPNYFS